MKIKSLYYYVPPCPTCGSHMTGRFVKDHRTNDIEWVIDNSLKHGELVRPMPEIPPYADAFCAECDYEWFADIHHTWVTNAELKLQKTERHTNEILAARYAAERQKEKEKKRERE